MLMPNSEIVCNIPGYCKLANYVVCNDKKATKAWLFGMEILVLKISMFLKFREVLRTCLLFDSIEIE